MKLHTFVGSPNSRKVQAVVSHLGLEIQVEYHDFVAGDLRTADYVALNPNGMVPLLVDGALGCGNRTQSCSTLRTRWAAMPCSRVIPRNAPTWCAGSSGK